MQWILRPPPSEDQGRAARTGKPTSTRARATESVLASCLRIFDLQFPSFGTQLAIIFIRSTVLIDPL